jgi:hypothetical protein
MFCICGDGAVRVWELLMRALPAGMSIKDQ